MTRFRRYLLATLFLACITAVGWSADKVVTCTAKNSEVATVPQIAKHPENYSSRCVAVRGVMRWDSLFESVDGVYLRPTDMLNPSSSGFRLGLDHVRRYLDERYRHVSIIGRVQDCEEIRDWVHSTAGENEVVMVSGYCHHHNGAYLWVNELRFRTGPPFYRQMGRYERVDYGDLKPAPETWPYRAVVQAQADKFLTALRTQDRHALSRMHYNIDDKDLKYLLSDRRSPFASIRSATEPPQQIILVYKAMADEEAVASADPDGEDDYGTTICFCREKDCTGRWPIAMLDADNLPSRPYACTELTGYLAGSRDEPSFETEIAEGGLEEP